MARQSYEKAGLSRFVVNALLNANAVSSRITAPKSHGYRPMSHRVNHLTRVAKVFSWRKHAATQQLLPATSSHFLRPIHPPLLAQAEKVPRILIRRQAQVMQPKHDHARRPLRPG